jgi:hypothetical protein
MDVRLVGVELLHADVQTDMVKVNKSHFVIFTKRLINYFNYNNYSGTDHSHGGKVTS